ncbi:MAG: glutamate--tRNA ligase [Candidatus Glassbacteria bacterium]|nr:glutamate--tRNA ligase [Candidatus Glassbacteria bacterium]
MTGRLSEKIPVMRFAPSPTGYLHLGGARTALFNYLLARKLGGRFLLRVEDTDRRRSTPEAVGAILDGLSWLGIEWDGEIVFQSRGLERHLMAAHALLEKGAAYRCFCTPERLEKQTELARLHKKPYIYDRTCLALDPAAAAERAAAGEPHVLRFRIPPGETAFRDGVHGEVRFDNKELEDFVILRSDGTPTYQLAVVADDIYMGITHIIRGDDHISNTPKQLLLYRALEAEAPEFAHVPLILGPDKKRLSKRHGATGLVEYREQGFLSQAVFNFLALLGWSPGEDREILERRELVNLFSLGGINKRNAVFDQTKLLWMNGQYLSRMAAGEVLDLVKEEFLAAGLIAENSAPPEKDYLLRVLDLVRQRCRLTSDLLPRSRYFFPVELEYDQAAVDKHWKPGAAGLLSALADELQKTTDWSENSLEELLRTLAEKLHVSAGKLIHPLRVALTGMDVSPGIFEVMALMGRDLVLDRLGAALERFEGIRGN